MIAAEEQRLPSEIVHWILDGILGVSTLGAAAANALVEGLLVPRLRLLRISFIYATGYGFLLIRASCIEVMDHAVYWIPHQREVNGLAASELRKIHPISMRYVEGVRIQFTHPIGLDSLLLHSTSTSGCLHWSSQYQVHNVVRGEQTQEWKEFLSAHAGGTVEEGHGVASKAGIVQIQRIKRT